MLPAYLKRGRRKSDALSRKVLTKARKVIFELIFEITKIDLQKINHHFALPTKMTKIPIFIKIFFLNVVAPSTSFGLLK